MLLEPNDGRVFLGELLLDAFGTKGRRGNEERREAHDYKRCANVIPTDLSS